MSKRIFVALNLCDTSGRNSLSGILRYVNAKCNWQLDVRSSFENYTPAFVNSARRNGYDGIITGYPEASQCLNELLRTDLPVVFNVRPEDLSVPPRQIVKTAFVDVDNAAIALTAARHFLYRGSVKSVAFISDREERIWSQERERAFASFWQKEGIGVDCLVCRSEERPLSQAKLIRFLKELPKPAAVWCVYDVTAERVARACRAAGVSVPCQIALLGADDDVTLCRSTEPTLSSVAIDHEQIGYRCAEILDNMLKGRKSPSRPVLVKCSAEAVVERDSTRRTPPTQHLIDLAVRYIEANAMRALTVEEVIRHLGVSRPLADLRFRTVLGKSIGRTIRELRVAEIKRRALSTDERMASLAGKCGFGSASRLAHFFKRETGCSLGAWRRQFAVSCSDAVSKG